MPAKRSKSKPQPMEGNLTMRQAVAMRMQALLNQPVSFKMGHASFETGGKVYCFVTRDGGLSMKLPATHIQPLLEGGEARMLDMNGRVMREWVVVPESGSAMTLRLLHDAKVYVDSLPASKRKPATKKSAKKTSIKTIAAKKNRDN